jgi:predicted HAD superfamily Cof-like phosphohydrolase
MEKQLLQVRAFQTAFGAPLPDKPTMLDQDRSKLRQKLLQEEVTELKKAKSMEDVADALCDIMYIALGTTHEYGLADRLPMMFDEVHISNMRKLDIDGKPIYRKNGKVAKPEGWKPPNLKFLLNRKFHVLKKAEENFKEDFSDQIAAIAEVKERAWKNRVDSEIMNHLGWFNKLRFKMISRIENSIKKSIDVKSGTDGMFRRVMTITSKKGTTKVTDEVDY